MIIRQLCIKQKRPVRHKKPQGYLNEIPLTSSHHNDDDDGGDCHRGRPALSETDSMKARYIHRRNDSNPQNDGQSNQPLTVPLKSNNRKTTFCRNLVQMNSKTDLMMNDIIDDIELHPHSNPFAKAKQYQLAPTQAEDIDFESSSTTLSDDNSDDTMMEKPHHHNYSTMTLRSGLQIVDNLSNTTVVTSTNASMVTMNGKAAYHEISRSNFGRLQQAINNAKTHSDFEKLEKIIKKGKIPQDNWHGKGKEYETENCAVSVSESSEESKSESSEEMEMEYKQNVQLLPVPNIQQQNEERIRRKNGHFAVKQIKCPSFINSYYESNCLFY